MSDVKYRPFQALPGECLNPETGETEMNPPDIECFAEHARMANGDICATCGFKAVPLEGEFQRDPRDTSGQAVCQYQCDHACTLVGHAYEALRFMNRCMEHGIVRSAVEGDPEFSALLQEMTKTRSLFLQRHVFKPDNEPYQPEPDAPWPIGPTLADT